MPRSTSHASNGPATAPIAFWWNASSLAELGVGRDERAADDVGVPAEVLRRRVHDDVGAERERLLQVGRGEGVVDDQQRAGVVRDRRPAPAMSAMPSSGLVGVSHPDRPWCSGRIAARTASRSASGTGVYSTPQRSAPARPAGTCRRTRRRGSPRGRPGRHSVRSRVSSAARPLANASPRRAALERGQALLQRGPGRVGAAAVLVAAAQPADAVLLVGRGLVDRRRRPRRSAGRAPARRGWRASRSRSSVVLPAMDETLPSPLPDRTDRLAYLDLRAPRTSPARLDRRRVRRDHRLHVGCGRSGGDIGHPGARPRRVRIRPDRRSRHLRRSRPTRSWSESTQSPRSRRSPPSSRAARSPSPRSTPTRERASSPVAGAGCGRQARTSCSSSRR